MDDRRLELLIAPARDAIPIRVAITKAITTIGAAPSADVRLLSVPAQWAAVHAEPGVDALSIHLIADGDRRELAPGDQLTIAGVTLSCERVRSDSRRSEIIEQLASALTSAVSADAALRQLLAGAIAAADADSGAIIITEHGAYRVAAALDASGAVVADAAALLSDTIVRDVLGTGQRVQLTNVAAHARYAQVPSVVSLRLQSALCLPMLVEGRPWGALFLGKRDVRASFGDRVTADLKVLAAMAVPFLAQLRRAAAPSLGSDELLGESPAIDGVRELVRRVGPSDLSVLVLGASGTGKELVARAVHAASPRAAHPLIALNCASVPESLLGAELFGYQKGAFTGANTDRKGLIEAAHGSTLFLDEVGDMPLSMQAALLRVLEQREVKRLGETTPRAVDFRLIAATNRDLTADVEAGRFRRDLLYRLEELTISLPPLAERGDDVLLLAHVFLRQAETQLSLPRHAIADDAAAALRAHPWPGNVRELRATMRRAAVLATSDAVSATDLQIKPAAEAQPIAASELGDTTRALAEARDDFVQRYVSAVVARHGGNREDAARALGIGVRTLYRYLAE